MKTRRLIGILGTCFLSSAAIIALVNSMDSKAESNYIAAKAEEVYTELDLTTVAFSNTPVGGWGAVNVNKDCTGGDIVVNGKTYAKGFGFHIHDDAGTPCTMEFDISTLATQYEFFESQVAMVDGGNNCVFFRVLVDDVVQDEIYWRKGYNSGEPSWLRVSIKGGSKLTLNAYSTGFGYANGTSAWLNPRLYNANDDRVFASDILDRMDKTTNTGWSYINGMAEKPYLKVLLDQRVNAHEFSELAPFGEQVKQTKGIGIQLVDGSYTAYEADKTVANKYTSLKWNIKDRGFTMFNTHAIMATGGGAHIDIWVDGQEAYKSDMVSAANAGIQVNFKIPANAEEFEIRVIPHNGFGDGLVDLLGAAFYRQNENLYTWYAQDTMAPAYVIPDTRGFGGVGEALKVYDGATQTTLDAEKGIFMHVGREYVFDVEGITYGTLSGKVGALAGRTDRGNTKVKATFTYADDSIKVKESAEFTYATSNMSFEFNFHPTNLKTIKLELTGDLAFSASALNGAKFSNVPAKDECKADTEWHSDANGHFHQCEICDAEMDRENHSFGDWGQTKAPTYTEKGEESRTCSVCSYVETRELAVLTPVQNGIVVTTQPTKLTYKYGEDLDTTGLVVNKTMTYGDGDVVALDDLSFEGYNKNQLGQQTITVKHGEYQATFQVEVIDYTTGIEMKANPTKVEYEIGEQLAIAGGKINVVKASGAKVEMDITSEMVSGFDSSAAGEVTITVALGDFETTFKVTIKAAPVQSSSEAPASSSEKPVVSSSEAPVVSSSEAPVVSSSETPVEPAPAKGCGGAVVGSVATLIISSIAGAILLASKKKEK